MRLCNVCCVHFDDKSLTSYTKSTKFRILMIGLCKAGLMTESKYKLIEPLSRVFVCRDDILKAKNSIRKTLSIAENGNVWTADVSDAKWSELMDISKAIFMELDERFKENIKQFIEYSQEQKNCVMFTKNGRFEGDIDSVLQKIDEEFYDSSETSSEEYINSSSDYDCADVSSDSAASDYSIPSDDASLNSQYFLVRGDMLKELCSACPRCKKPVPLTSIRLRKCGTAPILNVYCEDCFTPSRKYRSWFGQPPTYPGSRAFAGNTLVAISAYTTGLRFPLLKRFAMHCNMSMIGSSAFGHYSSLAEQAVHAVYDKRQKQWLERIRDHYKELGISKLRLASDCAYDSRGYSALIGKTVGCDQMTGLIMHIVTLHRSETNNSSAQMERAGLKLLIKWVEENGFVIEHICTDRSVSVTKALEEIGQKQKYDAWHLSKSAGNKLRLVSKKKSCQIIVPHIRSVKAHIWRSIAHGNETKSEKDIPKMVNCLLHHAIGEHEWDDEEETGDFNKCGHGAYTNDETRIVKGSDAENALKKVILDVQFQKALEKGDLIGTSKCETKNALDRLYCSKEVYYPKEKHHTRAMMSTLHLNELTCAEIDGVRTVERTDLIRKKYQSYESKLVKKTSIRLTWRDDVIQCVREKMEKEKTDRKKHSQDLHQFALDIEDLVSKINFYEDMGLEYEHEDEDDPFFTFAQEMLHQEKENGEEFESFLKEMFD